MSEAIIYHSFNARNLTSNEVARTFIKNSHFEGLMQVNHSLLLGARGCGKTTLLKMLTPEANYLWNKNKSNEKINLPFYAVYIPTDSQWKIELNDLSVTLSSINQDFVKLISKVIVTTNIINSLIDTFKELILINSDDSDSYLYLERELSLDLIDIFEFEKPISPDLNTLGSKIQNRVSQINKIISKAKANVKIETNQLPDYFFSDFFSVVSEAVYAFKKIFIKNIKFKDSHFRWALCFDELELAPEWLQDNLLTQLRSRKDQHIIFKLTSTPIIKIEKKLKTDDLSLEASNSNDYNVIRSWTHNRDGFKEWNDFANRLTKFKIANYFKKEIDPTLIFDKYNIEKIISSKNSEVKKSDDHLSDEADFAKNYNSESDIYQLIVKMSLVDISFRTFLESKDINPFHPVPRNIEQMGSIFRKMKPILIYRSQFKKTKSGSRKNIPFYFGVNNIYDICDGNPRFLTGLIDSMLKSCHPEEVELITPNKQSEIIYNISKNYLEILESHPGATIMIHGRFLNLARIVNIIGSYFFDEIVNKEFKINPVGSFVVDRVNDNVINLIELGIRIGAFVYLDPSEAVSETGILNKRFRLSYLLHPNFKLPIRDYESRKLSSILKLDKFNTYHPTLFND